MVACLSVGVLAGLGRPLPLGTGRQEGGRVRLAD